MERQKLSRRQHKLFAEAAERAIAIQTGTDLKKLPFRDHDSPIEPKDKAKVGEKGGRRFQISPKSAQP